MSKSNAFETSLQTLIFNNTDIANIGDAGGLRGSVADGVLYVSLHTANPDEGGSQNTNETSYTGYARISVARTAAGWTIAGNNVSNAAKITFGTCTVGTPTITHFGIGTDLAGAGNLLYWGALTAPLAVSPGIYPEFGIGDLDVNED